MILPCEEGFVVVTAAQNRLSAEPVPGEPVWTEMSMSAKL
jgi:hypothetical protein